MAFTPSIVSPVLIGRTSQLETLVHLMQQACGGHGQTVLLAGEAGIGKSRLVAEATKTLHSSQKQAAHPEALLLQGRCFEPDHALPYAPLLDMLRTFIAASSPESITHSLGPAAPELVKLLPELAVFLPGLSPSSVLDPEQEKRRLYQALTNFFIHLSTTQPLQLIFEDVHWSDETSLEFLLYLARRVAPHPIHVLLTYRTIEIHPGLARFLASLDRERLATELALTRLSIDEVGAMIRAIFALPRPVDTDFLEAISALTEGNPFFIEEILKSLIAGGEIYFVDKQWNRKPLNQLHIPRSVQVAVQQRLDHLTPDARQLLSLAAVAGRRFDFTLVQQLTRRNETELLHLVKDLITAQLLVEESEETFAFRHALTRQAVYSDLLARERKALHRSIAETMERIYTGTLETRVDDLAYHFFSAGVWDKALEYARHAGEKARNLFAPRASLEHFTHAIESAHQLSLLPPPTLYQARAQAYETLGEFDNARRDYELVLETARQTQDQMTEWRSLLDLGILWTERDYAHAGIYFERAIALARAIGDPSILAHTLNRVGNWHGNLEQPHEGVQYHLEALEIFQGLNDERGRAETLDFLGTTSIMASNLSTGVEYYEQAIALFRALGDRQKLISSLGMATMRGTNYLNSTLVYSATSGAECIRDAGEALALARQIAWRSGEAFALNFLGLALSSRGEYARALTCGQAALDIVAEIEHGLWMTFTHFLLGSLFLDLLVLPEAQQHLEQALSLARESGSLFWLRITTGSLASTYLAQGDIARADSLLNSASGHHLPCQTFSQRFIWTACAELELARHQPDSALQIIDHLVSVAPIEPGSVIPRLWRLRAEALLALKRDAEAEAVLHAAQATARNQGNRPVLWRICVTLGKFFSAQGQREQALEAFSEARVIIEELAVTIPDEAVRDNFLRCSTVEIPRLPQSSPRRIAKQVFGGLTDREREVAALIAQGKTNRALAAELVVSERTIEKHIERIMAKLGFARRSQIAVWASEKGLAK